jgi:hypothetical protein
MWLHPAVQIPRDPVQDDLTEVPRRLCPPRLPLQPIQQPRPRLQRRHSIILPTQLWSYFPRLGKDGCQWREGGGGMGVEEEGIPRVDGHEEGEVEL